MSPKFQVYKSPSKKTRFRLRGDDNKIVAIGAVYKTHAGCVSGIRNVQKNSGARIEDLTKRSGPKIPNPKYQIYKEASGVFRFRLKAANGDIIAIGEKCETKDGCFKGIEVVKTSSEATVEDRFSRKKSVESNASPKTTIRPEPEQVETNPEAALIEEEDESLSPAAPILSAKKGLPENNGPLETSLELGFTQLNFAKGDKVVLRGNLRTLAGQGISGAKICILARNRSILGDDYLAFGYTSEDGSFIINWKARRLSWRKETGEIYASFVGNEKAKASKSKIQAIVIK